jgi:anthranilate synthase component 1
VTLDIKDCGDYFKIEIASDFDLLDCHAANPQRYPFLLESNDASHSANAFDILFGFPGEKIESSNIKNNQFFAKFDHAFEREKVASKADKLPFTGGWFVFLSYELIGVIEEKLSDLQVDKSLPVVSAVRIPLAIIRSHQDNRCWIVCEKGHDALIKQVLVDLESLEKSEFNYPTVKLKEDPSNDFLAGVKKIKSYLIEGDTLQVNLSRQWAGEFAGQSDYLDVYRSLRVHNPSPFAGLACFGETVICSSSPERLISCVDDVVQMRPIAGTRPRDKDELLDNSFAQELLFNAKESAEHIMLIDLIRNDLGRICTTGTVKVDEKMSLESYAEVHHIVSNITGKLVSGMSPSNVIKAVFPGGTITGCPKVRCMEIINELEKTPRGAYTGSMGYINRNGNLDLNILIRTFTINDRQLTLRTGAGIVADSIAEKELEETRHKAKALLQALNISNG